MSFSNRNWQSQYVLFIKMLQFFVPSASIYCPGAACYFHIHTDRVEYYASEMQIRCRDSLGQNILRLSIPVWKWHSFYVFQGIAIVYGAVFWLSAFTPSSVHQRLYSYTSRWKQLSDISWFCLLTVSACYSVCYSVSFNVLSGNNTWDMSSVIMYFPFVENVVSLLEHHLQCVMFGNAHAERNLETHATDLMQHFLR